MIGFSRNIVSRRFCCSGHAEIASRNLYKLTKFGSVNANHCEVVSLLGTIQSDFDNLSIAAAMRTLKALHASLGRVQKTASVSMADLVLVDLQRQLHQLSPTQITDILCFFGAFKFRNSLLLRPGAFAARFGASLSGLSMRQATLGLWSLTRSDPPQLSVIAPSILQHFQSDPAKLASMTARDQSLFLRSLVSAISFSESPKQFVESIFSLLPTLGIQCTKWSFQESAMLVLSLARLRDYSKKLGLDSAITDGIGNDSILRLHSLLRVSQPSTESLLTAAWGLALMRFRSQPVLVDLYRSLYSRVGEMSPNQAAFSAFLFATCSGLRDDVIADAFVAKVMGQCGCVSNNNLVNLGLAAKKMRKDSILSEIAAIVEQRQNILKPGQLVIAAEFANIESAVVARFGEFSFADLIRYIPVASEEGKWTVQRQLIERMKKKENVLGSDLILLASEVRRLGPRVLPNFRVRFNKLLVRAIEQRRVPTSLLLSNLKLVDDLGSWHCMSYATQVALWRKASELQRIDVREPLDSRANDPAEVRRRRIDSKQLIVRLNELSCDDEAAAAKTALKKEERAAREEQVELEEVTEGITPTQKFINTVRQNTGSHNS